MYLPILTKNAVLMNFSFQLSIFCFVIFENKHENAFQFPNFICNFHFNFSFPFSVFNFHFSVSNTQPMRFFQFPISSFQKFWTQPTNKTLIRTGSKTEGNLSHLGYNLSNILGTEDIARSGKFSRKNVRFC